MLHQVACVIDCTHADQDIVIPEGVAHTQCSAFTVWSQFLPSLAESVLKPLSSVGDMNPQD